MRSRILLPLLVLVVAGVVLLLVPGLQSLARERTNDLGLERRSAVERMTELARVAVEDEDPLPLRRYVARYHDLYGEDVLVVAPGRENPIAGTGGLDQDDDEVAARIRDFGYNRADLDVATVQPWSRPSALISAPVVVDRDLSGGMVLLEVDQRSARADVRRGWLVLLVPTLLLLVLLVLATSWWTRWILRPVAELDDATEALASGEPVPDLAASGPPELRRLEESFRRMATTLSQTIGQQRELVANTSHQLRNPLAAVRLHADLLAGETGGTDSRTLEALQADLDRLDATVARLLATAEAEHRVLAGRAARVGQDVEVATDVGLLGDHVRDRWSGLPGPAVEVAVEPGPLVAATEHDLVEMVDTVLENAVKYAGDDAVVRVSTVLREHRVEVRVDDDGPGLAPEDLERAGTRFWRAERHRETPGTGLGLALVDALARASGGGMRLGRSSRGGLEVVLDLPRVQP